MKTEHDVCLSKLTDVKEQVSRALAAEYGASLNTIWIERAVREADALAATTPFPGLFLPALAEEKVRSAFVWNHRQSAIRKRTLAHAA